MAALFDLAAILKPANKKWDKFLTNFTSEQGDFESILKSWATCHQRKCCISFSKRYFKIIQDQNPNVSDVFWDILTKNDTKVLATKRVESSCDISSATAAKRQFLCLENDKNKIKEVDQMLANVANAMENNDVSKFFYFACYLKEK